MLLMHPVILIRILMQISISQRGEGSHLISGHHFSAGMYLYALIVDGTVVDTKRMILTK